MLTAFPVFAVLLVILIAMPVAATVVAARRYIQNRKAATSDAESTNAQDFVVSAPANGIELTQMQPIHARPTQLKCASTDSASISPIASHDSLEYPEPIQTTDFTSSSSTETALSFADVCLGSRSTTGRSAVKPTPRSWSSFPSPATNSDFADVDPEDGPIAA